jgi:hypothetical protein
VTPVRGLILKTPAARWSSAVSLARTDAVLAMQEAVPRGAPFARNTYAATRR